MCHGPPPDDHPLFALDNVILSPHSAGLSKEAAIRMAISTARNVLAGIDGKLDPSMVVNREVLSRGTTACGVGVRIEHRHGSSLTWPDILSLAVKGFGRRPRRCPPPIGRSVSPHEACLVSYFGPAGAKSRR